MNSRYMVIMTKTYYKASGIWLGYLRNLTDLLKFKTQKVLD